MTGSDDSLCCTELSIWPSCCMTGSFFVMLLIWCSSSTLCSWSRMLIGLHTASNIVGDRRCQLELPTLSTLVNSAKRVIFAPPAASSDAGEDVLSFRFRSLSIVLFFSQGTIKALLKHHQQCIITTAQLFSPPKLANFAPGQTQGFFCSLYFENKKRRRPKRKGKCHAITMMRTINNKRLK